MTHIHVNTDLTDDLESQGYHLVDKHQLAKMQQLEKVARAAEAVRHFNGWSAPEAFDKLNDALDALEAMK